MQTKILTALAVAIVLGVPQVSLAKGCMKGAAAGGVVGHVAGGHGVAGAAAGCAIGHHRAAKKADKQQATSADQTGQAKSRG